MLEVRNLHAGVEETEILKGLDFHVKAGEVHAIMGPNGSGKSTLSYVLAGRDGYNVTEGEILLNGENLIDQEPEERAAAGVFLSFQYPVEIPGVSNMNFIRSALNAQLKVRGEEEMNAMDFLQLLRQKAAILGVSEEMLKRSLNTGFSGGEKKRNEILQMMVLEPKLCILDETDSGLDIDALKTVAEGVNAMRSPERGMIIITHYQRLLNYIQPDQVHILSGGKIVRSGGKGLAKELEDGGYDAVIKKAA